MTIREGTLLAGRYRLDRLAGRGGMADVYLAFDNKRQAQVAVKILREDLAEDPDFVRRFRHEAEALARLDHPNIVRFYGFEQDGPVAFIVMDYIEGATLRRQLHDRRGPLEVTALTGIVRDLCSALHYAHLNGFVHRDLKPGNVMLKPDGRALLTDFGVVRAVEGVTLTVVTMGTPAYMSPEQIEGDEVDARSDIYSLGVLLFEMATGRRPFTGEEPGLTQTSTTGRIREAHLHLLPPDPRTLNPKLPAAAAEVILRALAKNRSGRWPDAVSLREAWEAAVDAAPAPVRARDVELDDHPPPRPVHSRRPRIWLVAGAIMALLAAVGALAFAAREMDTKQPAALAPVSPPPAVLVPTRPPTFTPRPLTTGGGLLVQAPAPLPTATAVPALPTRGVTGGGIVLATPAGALPSAGGPTLIPTFTVQPTRTPVTPTLRPTAIPTSTLAPTRAPVIPASQPTARPATPVSSGGVDLIRPPEGDKIIGQAEFEWRAQSTYALRPDERYELIVWGEGEDPMRSGRSPVGGKTETKVTANLSGVETALGLTPGSTYYWGVRLMTADGTPVRMLSGGRRFVYERASSGSGGQSYPPCVGEGCSK